MIAGSEGELDQAVVNHREYRRGAFKVKSGLSEHRLAGQERLRHPSRELHRPLMMMIVAIRKRHQEPSVRYAIQALNPAKNPCGATNLASL